MDVYVKGKGAVHLGQADFVAKGGEGAVYGKGKIAYKVYSDPQKMIPAAKMQELAALDAPPFLRPLDVLLDAKNVPIGYTMRRAPEGYTLCQLIPRAFRERHNIALDTVRHLVGRLRDGVQAVHAQNILIVDLNEMNFLTDKRFQELFFLDVDSYQTPGFPATALMDSIRDRHAAKFSRETDWFAFAIVSFQMFVGIHPYKGKHPSLTTLEERMLANVSVLNKKVALPPTCYSLDSIPKGWRDWYRVVFEDGKRLLPPNGWNVSVTLTPVMVTVPLSTTLKIEPVGTFPAAVLAPIPGGGRFLALTVQGLTYRGKVVVPETEVKVGFTPRNGVPIAAWLADGKVRLYDVQAGQEIAADIAGDALMAYDGRLYAKCGDCLNELTLLELPAGVRVSLRTVGNLLPNAASLYDGVAIQNLLGAWYAVLVPQAGQCLPVRLKELDGRQVVEAKYENRVLMAIAAKDGQYDRFVFRFDREHRSYDVRQIPDVANVGLNFVTLDSGVCVSLTEDGELEIFSHRPGSTDRKTLADAALQGVRLFKDGTQVLFPQGDMLYRVSM